MQLLVERWDGVVAEGGNELLPPARRKNYCREVVGKEDRMDRGGGMSEMWGGRADDGPHSVLLWEDLKSEGRKGKERLGKGKRDEVG